MSTPPLNPRFFAILLFVGIVLTSGCTGLVPVFDDNIPNQSGSPRAELLSFQSTGSECLDSTGLGSNITAIPTSNTERIIIKRAIITSNPNATLNPSLQQNRLGATNWTLSIMSHDNNTNPQSCRARISYKAIIEISNTSSYKISFVHNGEWDGKTFENENGGGSFQVARIHDSKNNTTTAR